MQIFDANITDLVLDFFRRIFLGEKEYNHINKSIEDLCGCKDFFLSEEDLNSFKNEFDKGDSLCVAEERGEYGDYQTNESLAKAVTEVVFSKGLVPDVIIEPTCGKGNFILAALRRFPNVKEIIGVEIYNPYVWQCKFNILNYFLSNNIPNKPTIRIIHANIFNFDFQRIKEQIKDSKLLVLGNPPWVNNSTLGALESHNLPQKTNFKKQKGIDAITGKGNFDIAEYIVLSLMRVFEKKNGYMSLLVKNSVIKNVVYAQHTNEFFISEIEEMNIDSKKEFNVSVDASLLLCKFNSEPAMQCQVFDFYDQSPRVKFGWIGNQFYADIDGKQDTIDGRCPLEWRQGIKHDCSSVMELQFDGARYINKLNEEVQLEDDMVYGILKSSDLKGLIATDPKRFVIITQKSVGQNTEYISRYPQTHAYLYKHIDQFHKRKSSIYKGKPEFSIFGVGDYSFKPYKVAISGLYKTFHFTLIESNNKPVMLDDTCYFLGFDELKEAVVIHTILNSDKVCRFLQSITFHDAKRMITKEVLMRIDFRKALKVNDIDTLVSKANETLSKLESDSKLGKDGVESIINGYYKQLELLF